MKNSNAHKKAIAFERSHPPSAKHFVDLTLLSSHMREDVLIGAKHQSNALKRRHALMIKDRSKLLILHVSAFSDLLKYAGQPVPSNVYFLRLTEPHVRAILAQYQVHAVTTALTQEQP